MTSGNPIILCVDDERANLRLLENILVPREYEVVTASSGEEALEKIQVHNINLVLLDIMLPEMDGFEVCRKIKENTQYRNIPVIMITALIAKQERIKGIEAGAEEFLSKPFDQTEVLARVKMLLRAKELNDKLNYAYDNINRLTVFGENIVNTFNPLEFEFMSKIDSIVSQMIQRASDMTERPETVLVCMLNELKQHEWHLYESVFDKLERTPIQMSMDLRLSKTEPSRLLFYNEAMVEDPMFRSVAEKLRRFNIIARNMVCYMSEPLCIFALNYGREVSSYDAAVLNSIVMQTLFLRSIASQIKETDNAFEYTVNALARASEVNDEDTGNHILRVGIYSALIATQLKMPQDIINALRIQASLHDVGKIHVSAAILKKSGKLTSDEWLEMRKHPLFGQKIIGEHSRLKIGSSIARTHHERYDGSGYPKGLRGDDIPIEGRIVAIADQYDALRLARVYKPAFTHDDTCRIILNGDGRTMPEHFDPQVLKAFHDVSTKFEEGYEAFKG